MIATGYNIAGVSCMTANRVQAIINAINHLQPKELEELLEVLRDKLELIGWLKVCEPTFADWDNEDDAVYDRY